MTCNVFLKATKQMLMLAAFAAVVFPVAASAAGWGAISAEEVIGDKDPFWGVGGGNSKAEASKNSQKFCREAGGKKCEVLVTYQKCGAYAASKQYSGTGTGTTKKVAEQNALKVCNNRNCSVVTSDCND